MTDEDREEMKELVRRVLIDCGLIEPSAEDE